MDLKEQQLRLMDTLLRSVSRNAQDPKAFKLFFGVFWKDMADPAGGRTGRYWEPQVYFSCVLCRDDEVLTVAAPRILLEEGGETPLSLRQLNALQAAGIPLLSDFLIQRREKGGTLTLHLRSRYHPSPSGWRFPTVRVPSELSDLLHKKRMISSEHSPGSPEPVPTDCGNFLGLCETRWYGEEPAGHPDAGLYCSSAGWVNRVRLGEHPWGDGPDWVPLLPLDTRLEWMRAGRAVSPGHCMSALLRLEAMPVAPLLSGCMRNKHIEKNRSELQALYGSGVTYGQAARNADRLLRSHLEEERTRGESILRDLVLLYTYDHKLRTSQSTYRKAEDVEAINKVNEVKAADRSLSARLARAGISENGSPYLPLTGDCLEDVFQGLNRLIGTDALEQAFYRETPALLWIKLGSKWDGSLDGLICGLWELCLEASHTMEDPAFESEVMQVFRRLLIEPFCLLAEIRSLEEKHSALLKKIQKQNKTLKKELERMNFDGSTH